MKKEFTLKTIRCNLADVLRKALTDEFTANYPAVFVDTDENQNLLKRHPYYIPVKNCDTGKIIAKIWPQLDSVVICISTAQYKSYLSVAEDFDDAWKFLGTVEGENNCGEYVFRTNSTNLDDIINDSVAATIVILEAVKKLEESKAEKKVEETPKEEQSTKKAPAKKTPAKKSTKSTKSGSKSKSKKVA